MRKESFKIEGTPSILWGEPAAQIYLYIHGQGGCKEEAAPFSEIAEENNWQVLSVDLPEHGERGAGKEFLTPWQAVSELKEIIKYAAHNWKKVSLYANSIGAWLSMLSFAENKLESCLFVSPILNMERLIYNMMLWAGISEEQLQKHQTISTSFGQTLSWDYLIYAKQHSITKWNPPTHILYSSEDNLTERSIADQFAKRFKSKLTIMDQGEHWFHTPEQLAFLYEWIRKNI